MSLISTAAMSETIGVSMALFDDNFLTVLRDGIIELGNGMDDVDIQVEDAQNDVDSGTLETLEVCRLFAERGTDPARIYVMMGELSNQAAVQRTADIHDVMASGECGVTLDIIDEQTANWT